MEGSTFRCLIPNTKVLCQGAPDKKILCVSYINLWKTSESRVEPLLALGP